MIAEDLFRRLARARRRQVEGVRAVSGGGRQAHEAGVLAQGAHHGGVLVLGVNHEHVGCVVEQERAQQPQLDVVGLAGAAGAEDDHVGVAAHPIVEDVQRHRRAGTAIEAERHAIRWM